MAEIGDICTKMSRKRRNMVYLALRDSLKVNLPRLFTLELTVVLWATCSCKHAPFFVEHVLQPLLPVICTVQDMWGRKCTGIILHDDKLVEGHML